MQCSVLFSLLLGLLASFAQVDRSEAGRWFNQARRHFEKQEWEQSRSAAQRALRSDPQLADAEVLLGLIASLQAQPQEAERHLKQAIALEPDNHQAHSYLAGVYLQQKRLSQAESGYQQVLKLKPGNSVALYNLGLIALLRNQPDLALSNFNEVYHNNPRDASALLGLLETQLLLKRNVDARKSALRIEELLTPADPRLFQTATLLAMHQEYSSAIPILERLKKNAPGSFDIHYNLALAYVRTGQNDLAAQGLRSLPGSARQAEGLNLLGQVEEKRNRPQEALEAFSRAATLEPLNEQFRFDYANQLLQQELVKNAMEAFQQGCLDFARSWKMRVGLGAAHYLSGKYEESAQSLLQAIEIMPDASVAFFLLGKVYPLVTDSQETIRKAFDRYLEQPRKDAWAYFHSGNILFLQMQSQPASDFEPVIRLLRRALELSPRFAEASLQLGLVLQTQGKLEESIRLFEQAVASAPDMPSAHYRLAQAYQRSGSREKAQAEFTAYERLRAQSRSGEEVRSILQMMGR
jgi:tetratricopeptide (TPR) repeat protein